MERTRNIVLDFCSIFCWNVHRVVDTMTKDVEHTVATIRITKIREVTKINGRMRGETYKDKLWCCKIVHPWQAQTSFCETTKKKLFKRIAELIL